MGMGLSLVSCGGKKADAKGTVRFLNLKPEVAEIYQETNAGINEGDDLIIVGPTTGVVECKAENMMVNDKVVNHVSRGTVFSMKVPVKVRPSDKVYKMEDTSNN